MRRAVPLLVAALALAACKGPSAPEEPGVCFRVDASGGRTAFSVLARGVENLETCAVLLEGLNLQGHRAPTGAFQGYFIFVDADAIRSAPSLHGMRYPVFQPPQRVSIDKDLRAMMKTRGGQLPNAGDLSIERNQP
ncbi:MAG TPA: hypothetical protein VGF50_03040 [Caulobacteraceae bacterium]|jgi:hypothetical protein